MDYRVDEKGKYYTNYVNKRPLGVQVFTQGTVVSGTMHVMLGNRLKDELNRDERFVAITDAQVNDPQSGALLCEGAVILLNKEQIAWLVPMDPEHDPDSHTQSDPSA